MHAAKLFYQICGELSPHATQIPDNPSHGMLCCASQLAESRSKSLQRVHACDWKACGSLQEQQKAYIFKMVQDCYRLHQGLKNLTVSMAVRDVGKTESLNTG